MWLFFTLLAALLWGIGQIFAKKGLGNTTPLFNNLLAAVVTLAITVPFAILMGGKFSDIFNAFPLAILISILLLSYYYVIAKANISLIGTVLGTYPIFTVVLSLLFLNETPTIFQEVAAGLVMCGTLILVAGEDIAQTKKMRFGIWVLWGIGGSAAAGIADFLAKIDLKIVYGNTYTYILSYGIAFAIIACLSILFDKKGRKIPKINKKFLPTLVGVTMIESGVVSFYLALSQGFASIVAPISSIYVAITAILAWIFLKEKINKIQMTGVIVSVIGIILLGA